MPHEWEHFEHRGRPSEFDSTGRMTEPNRHAEVTADDFKTFLHDPFSREQVAERMKFLAAFASGDDVWRYSPRNYRGKAVPHWERVDFFDMHAETRFLSLVWRDDEPE